MIVHYLTPFSTAKNIGGEYNARISELPDDCYIVLRDGDTMFMLQNWGEQIEQIISQNPEYRVITCMANRLGVIDHCVPGMFGIDSIFQHIETAERIYSTEVVPAKIAPGLCMIFHKSVWNKYKFVENSIFFDKVFSAKVLRDGGKIGLATGLYLLHLYRYNKPDPKHFTKHLLT